MQKNKQTTETFNKYFLKDWQITNDSINTSCNGGVISFVSTRGPSQHKKYNKYLTL